MVRIMSRRQLLAAGMTGLAGAALAEMAGCGTSHSSPTQATATATLPTATATPVVRPVSMIITGDVMLGRSVNKQMVSAGTGGTFPFAQTGEFLKGFDLTVGNLECVVSKIGSPIPGKPFTFRADPLGFERLQGAGFDVVSVANNHSGDYGPDAFADMLSHLPHYGITAIGGGLNHDAAHTPVVVERFGTRIGFVAACDIDPPTFAATALQPGHAWLDAAGLRHDIPIARSQSDFLIVFTHWGVEYHLNFNAQQQELAHLAIDLGADLVVGAHPHDIEPNEIYHGKPIIYSLGNFVFDEMYDSESHGNVLTLHVQGNTLLDWKLMPITIDTTTGAPHLA
jgi:poly-gamma-glutamate capsule biosynthesis protein CapA/YwtB (metallophosphatase superfamily)